MRKAITLLLFLSGVVYGQTSIPATAGGATVPATKNLIAGDGAGNAVDSGIAPGSVQTGTTAPAFTANQPTAGCGVEYITGGLSLTVGACTYTINGAQYSSPQVTLTLATADTMNDRQDAIIVDITGVASVLTGTPAVNPIVPTVDPSTQLMLTSAYVATNATTPTNATVTNNIFDEGTEWAATYTAHISTSTTDPFRGTHSMQFSSAVLNNNAVLVKPSSQTVDLAGSNALVFYICTQAVWPTGASGATAARFLSIYWGTGGSSPTQKGSVVVLRDGQFGFKSAASNCAVSSNYQQVSIPTSLFGANGIANTSLIFKVSGNSGSSSLSFFIDAVSLQGGLTAPPLPGTLMNFRGTWSSTTAYSVNDVAVTAVGRAYVALAANTNVSVTTTATWQALDLPSFPDAKQIPFANCYQNVAGSGVTTATSNFTAACRGGSNNLSGMLQAIPSTGGSLQFMLELPLDWNTAQQPYINIFYGSGSNTSGTVIWTVSSACSKADGSVTDDPSFNAESAFASQTMANASRTWSKSGQFTAITSGNNCIPGGSLIIKAAVSGTASSNINAYQAVVTIPRILAVQAQ